jgi:GMP synthase (glutamine-hydrolysing)
MYLIINNSINTKKMKSVPKLINFFTKNNIPHIVINSKKKLIENLNKKIKGVILSGSDLSYTSKICNNQVNINVMVLLELNVPILGICFGFQTIGLFYGGTISKLQKMDKGIKNITLFKNDLFKNIKDNNFFQYHHDYLKDIPHNFMIIAKNEDNIINGIKHKYKPIYGVQFHPELSGSNGAQLLHNFIDICSNY